MLVYGDLVPVWIGLKLRLRLQLHVSFFFFFFPHAFQEQCSYCSCTVHLTVAAKVDFFMVNSAFVHCSQTHKFYFEATFSLKIGLTTLFTHLKIILLQCFQFSVLAK